MGVGGRFRGLDILEPPRLRFRARARDGQPHCYGASSE
jgi:hypothetical protein